ncbi:hypothetical protein ACV229_26265 [Burkholderia sp. MR1-5-21]
MKECSSSDKRKILGRMKRLFGIKSFSVPKSIGDVPIDKYFMRQLRLNDGHTIFLTDFGLEHFSAVVDLLDGADLFDGLVGYSDIWTAWRSAVEGWLSAGAEPTTAEEVIQGVSELVAKEVDNYNFAVPMFGVDLKGDASFSLGSMKIFRMSENYFEGIGVDKHQIDIEKICENNKRGLWITDSVRGTARIAQREFHDRAILAVGVLAIAAASLYEFGANNFRIGIEMQPDIAGNRVAWFSWRDGERSLVAHFESPSAQLLPVDEVMTRDSDMIRMLHRTFYITQKKEQTELDEAIARAVFWYSDAHRDSVSVMRFIKYWSCVEAFFSLDGDNITHAVSSGLAAQLVFGGFHFVPVDEYRELKKEITFFYKLRSRAIHRASHSQITERDTSRFSQLVAWLIVSMVGLVELGYTKLAEIKVHTDRLDAAEATRGSTGTRNS